jgi:hypothetical protein
MTMNRKVFGSSLASLVCVLEMSKSEKITWIQSGPVIAGHFRGFKFGELDVDLGMVALESYSGFNKHLSLPIYPPIRQSGLSFVNIAHNWLVNRGEEFQHIPVKSNWFGRMVPDYLIADNLTILNSLDSVIKLKMLSELRDIQVSGAANDNFHPRNKNNSDFFLEISFKDLIIRTLGPTFYKILFEPWIRRFDLEVADKLPARDHRSAWVPIYYPETVIDILSGALPPSHLERPFVVPRGDSVASLIRRLLDSISISSVEIVQDFYGKVLPSRGDVILDSTIKTKEYLGENAKTPLLISKKVAVAVLILKFDEVVGPDQIVNFVDTDNGPYRALIRTLNAGQLQSIISIEFGAFYEYVSDEDILQSAVATLSKLGISIDFKENILKRMSLRIPSAEERSTMECSRNSAFEQMQSRELVGFPVDFGSSALNDQLLLGLWSENESRRNG